MQLLLSRTSSIIEKHEEIRKIKGEDFNIFKILNVSTNEVNTHTRFLSELLNMAGSHGMGNVFFKEFLKIVDIKNVDIQNTRVYREKYIGKISEDRLTGGNIDILVSDGTSGIIIENKIFAVDQEKQLIRYFNYAQQNYKTNFTIFYLTPLGHEVSKKSLDFSDARIRNISYREHIIAWIERCKEIAIDKPQVRETLNLYLQIIKEICGESNNNEMNNELVSEIVKNEENVASYFKLQDTGLQKDIKKELLSNFKLQLRQLAESLELRPEFDDEFGLKSGPSYLLFYLNDSSKGFYISLCFCDQDNNLVTQINCKEKLKDESIDDLLDVLPVRSNGFGEIWVQWFEEPFRNWSKHSDPWLKIMNGEMKKIVNDKFSDIIQRLKDSNIEL